MVPFVTMKKLRTLGSLAAAVAVLVFLGAAVSCTVAPRPAVTAASPPATANPLLQPWTAPFGVPPFDAIRPEHFLPAFEEAMRRHLQEMEAIASSSEPPTFANSVAALDDAGGLLDLVASVFSNLRSAETSDALQEVARAVTPRLAAHRDRLYLDERLFARVKAVWEQRDTLQLSQEDRRLLEETYSDFVRAGALLTPEHKQRMKAINEELASLTLQFSDNVLAATNAYRLVIEKAADLAGLDQRVVASAAAAAKAAGLDGKWVFTLHWPSLWPFLEGAENRHLRREIMLAYLQRAGAGTPHDNTGVLARIAALRVEKARLLGYPTWADFQLEKSMARTPGAVREFLDRLWPKALAAAAREQAELEAMMAEDGVAPPLQAWDWRYYARRVKAAKYALEEDALRPYFSLDAVREGAFWVCQQLYGITFTERTDLPVYHPEVRVFEVKEADGSHIGLLYLDYHPRPGKRGGAWSSTYRKQWIKDGRMVTPVVVNVGNFSRPTQGAPALLSLDEVETLFHELGHGLHQLLSKCRYRSLSGTSVPRDFVELPSQIMENWAREPAVLARYARHWQTGEPLPQEIIDKLQRAAHFNQGFATTEYLAAALLDMDWHTLTDPVPVDTVAFERTSLERMGVPAAIPPRYHSWYFNHIVGGYAAGYYSYIWAEVLEADAFEAFREKGLFDRATATAFRTHILERGGSEDPMTLYVRFRGRQPDVAPLLARRGL
jgi:peptidyl-dipeptidase Dcp